MAGRRLSWVLKLWYLKEAHIRPTIPKHQKVWAFFEKMTAKKALQTLISTPPLYQLGKDKLLLLVIKWIWYSHVSVNSECQSHLLNLIFQITSSSLHHQEPNSTTTQLILNLNFQVWGVRPMLRYGGLKGPPCYMTVLGPNKAYLCWY